MTNKKSQARLIKGIIISVLLISSIFVLAEEENITNSATPTIANIGKNNLINYKFDWGETNITLYKLINSDYVVFDDNLYIETEEKGWKYGANDNSLENNETAKYKFVIESSQDMILIWKEVRPYANKTIFYNETVFDSVTKKNETILKNYTIYFIEDYPILYHHLENPNGEEKHYWHEYKFDDICKANNSYCGWETSSNRSVNITFESGRIIDPTIRQLITDVKCKELGSPAPCTIEEINTSNNVYAVHPNINAESDSAGEVLSYHNATTIPAGSTIDNVTITVEWKNTNLWPGTPSCDIAIWNTTAYNTLSTTCHITEDNYTYDATAVIDTVDKANNMKFRINFKGSNAGSDDYLYVDWVYVNVSYNTCTPPASGNWNWNFADNCNLVNKVYSVDNITSYGSGTWTLDNSSITCTDFDMNSSGNWNVIAMPNVRIIGP